MTSQRTFVIAALFTTCLVVAASALALPSHFEEPELDRLQQIHSTAQRLQELIRLHVLHTSHGHSLLAKTVRCVDHNSTQSGGVPLGCDNLNQTINATLDCPTAQDQFNNLTQFCNVPYIVNGFADPLSVNISDIDKFCTGDCVTQLDLHLAQVVRSCWNNGSLDSFLLDAVREALIASKVPCLRVESSYCFSVWQNLTRISGFLANGTLSQQQILDTCWSDCADEQHAQLIRYGGGRQLGTTGFLKLLCTKVGVDEYCALVYQEVEKANQVTPPPPPPPPPSNNTNNTNSSSPSNSTVPDNSTSGSNSTVDPAEPPGTNGTCRICYRRFVQRANKTLTLAQGSGGVSNFNQQDFADRVNRLTYQCTRDSSGLCLDKISKNAQKSNNHQDLSSPCGTVFDNVNGPINDTCTSQCAKALKDLSNDLGCCALTFFQQKFNSSITDGYNPQLEHIYNFIKNSCQVSQFANSCSNKRIDFKLVLVNVRYSWLSNATNYAHFADAVRRDIAARLGVPFNSVKVLAIQDYIPAPATNNNSTDDVQCIDGERRVRRGVLVSGYVLPQTAAEVSQLQGSFAKAVLENRIDFSEAATWLPFDFQGRIDVLSQFGLHGVVSNITRVNNPGA